jgi:ABC-2 type transport system permease protein
MRLKRVIVLLRKEFLQGPKNFIFIWALIAPIIISVVVMLVFGSLLNDETELGIVDQGDSALVAKLEAAPSVNSKTYNNVDSLKRAVEEGALDGGVVLPDSFDDAVESGEPVAVDFYLWGESLAKDRTVMAVALSNLARELDPQASIVEIRTVTLGDEESLPWEDRLLPFIVLVTVFISGIMLAGTSLLAEKEKKTLDALAVTPTSLGEIFLVKGLLGVTMGTLMGVVILAINGALGSQPGLLVMMLLLGAIMASAFGLLMASLVKGSMTFFANMKMIGIFLYAPVIIYLFPTLPQWIGKFFPTYYIVQPIVEISQQGGGWAEIVPEVAVLIGLDALLIALLAAVVSRKRQYAV